jgi:hypothetical protein
VDDIVEIGLFGQDVFDILDLLAYDSHVVSEALLLVLIHADFRLYCL